MLINKAVMFATLAHEGQKRKGTDIPYIMHPLEVSVIVSQIKYDNDLVCAALLHDVIEDSHISYKSLCAMFSQRIADIVFFQSEDKSKSWQERKQHTLNELQKLEDDEIKIVCLADKLSNIRSISRDYAVLGNKLWERFNADKTAQGWYYTGLVESLISLSEYQAYKEFKRLVDDVFG
jgi:myo-inositol-1(or 4)-monophosphatase